MKLFLSDLDGTLLDASKGIASKDLAAIRMLKKHGIGFGMVTGRDYGFCKYLMQQYRFSSDVVIGNNGGSIWIKDNKVMEEQIDAVDTLEIMEVLKNHLDELNPFVCNERSVFYLMRNHYSKNKWEEVKKTLAYLGEFAEQDLLDYLKYEQEPVVKISIHTYTQECTDKWLPILQERFKERYEILPTSADYIEITRKGIDKGISLKWVMNHLGLQANEIVVIGDGVNDLSLFHEVPLSFSMDSAIEEVQREAAHVVKNVAEAIAFVIEYTTDNK